MASAPLPDVLTGIFYLISAGVFILSLRWMSSPETARRAVLAAVAAMSLAVIGTLFDPEIVTYKWIFIAAVLGAIVGYPLSRVPLTAVRAVGLDTPAHAAPAVGGSGMSGASQSERERAMDFSPPVAVGCASSQYLPE